MKYILLAFLFTVTMIQAANLPPYRSLHQLCTQNLVCSDNLVCRRDKGVTYGTCEVATPKIYN